jgi:2-enoate reductase
VIGGGMVGCETAEHMHKTGDNPLIGRTGVTVIEMLNDVALDISVESRSLLLQRMRKEGIEILTSTKVKEFLKDGVLVEKEGKDIFIRNVDLIVLGIGARSVDDLSSALKEKVDEVYVIGDAKQTRNILPAIVEGTAVGRKI